MDMLFTGVSGMLASQQAVDVIANNVANLNTIGFKEGTANFQDMLSNTISAGNSSTGPTQVGTGVAVGSVTNLMTQGTPTSTGNPLDLTIVGNGFFVVGQGTQQSYTRDGTFQLNDQDQLTMSSTGLNVLGWQADNTGHINTSTAPVTSLQIPLGKVFAKATTNVTLSGNLSAGAVANDSKALTFNIYDSLGTVHAIDLTLTKTATAGQWDWTASTPEAGASITGSGTITFDQNGNPTAPTTGSVTLTPSSSSVAQPDTFALDFSSVGQLDGDYSLQANNVDGLPMGTLQNYTIDQTGTITGTFSNGGNQVLGQLALAQFTNPSGLAKDGSNLWSSMPSSGVAVIQPPTAGGGTIRSGYLEASNVNLATEFANLIIMQRGYEANSRSITTADSMMQLLMQLKQA